MYLLYGEYIHGGIVGFVCVVLSSMKIDLLYGEYFHGGKEFKYIGISSAY